MKPYSLTKDRLLFDLYVAFECASKHKHNKSYVIKFKDNLYENLIQLRDELWNRTYRPHPSNCFIIDYPKKREVFAADFRDRIVHHLYFNYTYNLFEHTFIYDSYSCRIGKGTHFGINRIKHHISQESNNYKTDCYVLKMDIKGYFMNINRNILFNIIISTINKISNHKISNKENIKWCEKLDIDFIKYLTKEISLLDVSKNCVFKSPQSAWCDLPYSKSLFHTSNDSGLPIGNLTSQLFSNVFLNLFDQFIKRELKCKHYGRYVDDFYIVSKDKNFLHSIIPKIEMFLKNELQLDTNKGKTMIVNVKYGVEFLGAFLKPHRTYISNQSLSRMKKKICSNKIKNIESINSYLGILSHYNSFNIRKNIFTNIILPKDGIFNDEYTKFKSFDMLKI